MQNREQLIEQKKTLETEISQMKEDQKSLSKELAMKEKEIKALILQTVEKQRKERRAPYEEQLAKEQKAQNEVIEKRQKAKEKGIAQRVQLETAELQNENQQIKEEVRQAFRKDGAPFFCNTRWFYTLYYPQGFRDMLGFFLYILVGYFGIPWLVTFKIINPANTYIKVLLHIFCMAVVFGIYLLIRVCVRDLHLDVMKEQYNHRKKIEENKKEIKKITRSIQKDKDESSYNLDDFDKKMKKHQDEINKIKDTEEKVMKEFAQKEEAAIETQIQQQHQKELTDLKEQLEAMKQQILKRQNQVEEIDVQLQKIEESEHTVNN